MTISFGADAARMLVAEMTYLFKAKFETTNSGPIGEPRWNYQVPPELRSPARAFLKGVDRYQLGFDDAMIAAIHGLSGGAS